MVNDALSVGGSGYVERFQEKVAVVHSVERNLLVDFGSSTGKFLRLALKHFRNAVGIEVTPASRDFSRNVFQLTILPDLKDLDQNVSTVTFWHSLEHVPVPVLRSTLQWLAEHKTEKTRVIVSVPNAGSFQCSWLKRAYAFYDPENHVHQFTLQSLDLLFQEIGFREGTLVPSPLYSSFGALQGLLNLFNPIHNFMYYRKKRRLQFSQSRIPDFIWEIYNVILVGILFIPASLFFLLDLIWPKRGAVLTAVYRPV
jgi:hypothetical protein